MTAEKAKQYRVGGMSDDAVKWIKDSYKPNFDSLSTKYKSTTDDLWLKQNELPSMSELPDYLDKYNQYSAGQNTKTAFRKALAERSGELLKNLPVLGADVEREGSSLDEEALKARYDTVFASLVKELNAGDYIQKGSDDIVSAALGRDNDKLSYAELLDGFMMGARDAYQRKPFAAGFAAQQSAPTTAQKAADVWAKATAQNDAMAASVGLPTSKDISAQAAPVAKSYSDMSLPEIEAQIRALVGKAQNGDYVSTTKLDALRTLRASMLTKPADPGANATDAEKREYQSALQDYMFAANDAPSNYDINTRLQEIKAEEVALRKKLNQAGLANATDFNPNKNAAEDKAKLSALLEERKQLEFLLSENKTAGVGGNEYLSEAQKQKIKQAYDEATVANRIGEFTFQNTGMGALDFFKGMADTIDLVVPDSLQAKFLNDWLGDINLDYNRRAAVANYINELSNAEVGGSMVRSTVAAVPQLIVTLASGGASATAPLMKAAANGNKAAGVMLKVSDGLKAYSKDPQFWASFVQMAGPTYREAIDAGASEGQATTAAFLNAYAGSIVEVGGGFQKTPQRLQIPDNVPAIVTWLQGLAEEGNEEVIQGIIEGVTEKFVYDPKRAWTATGEKDAVVDPTRATQEWMGGAVVGGLFGGGEIGINAATNAEQKASIGKSLRPQLADIVQSAKDMGEFSIPGQMAGQLTDPARTKRITNAEIYDLAVAINEELPKLQDAVEHRQESARRQIEGVGESLSDENALAAAMRSRNAGNATDDISNYDLGIEAMKMSAEQRERAEQVSEEGAKLTEAASVFGTKMQELIAKIYTEVASSFIGDENASDVFFDYANEVSAQAGTIAALNADYATMVAVSQARTNATYRKAINTQRIGKWEAAERAKDQHYATIDVENARLEAERVKRDTKIAEATRKARQAGFKARKELAGLRNNGIIKNTEVTTNGGEQDVRMPVPVHDGGLRESGSNAGNTAESDNRQEQSSVAAQNESNRTEETGARLERSESAQRGLTEQEQTLFAQQSEVWGSPVTPVTDLSPEVLELKNELEAFLGREVFLYNQETGAPEFVDPQSSQAVFVNINNGSLIPFYAGHGDMHLHPGRIEAARGVLNSLENRKQLIADYAQKMQAAADASGQAEAQRNAREADIDEEYLCDLYGIYILANTSSREIKTYNHYAQRGLSESEADRFIDLFALYSQGIAETSDDGFTDVADLMERVAPIGEVKYSLTGMDDGSIRIIADRDIFVGAVDEADRIAILKKFINENLRGNDYTAISDGRVIGVARKNTTVGKLIRPGLPMDPQKYADRQEIAAMYDDVIVGSSEIQGSRGPDKRGVGEVSRREAIVEIPQFDKNGILRGSRTIRAELLVRPENVTERNIAYDIAKSNEMKNDTHSVLLSLVKRGLEIDRASFRESIQQYLTPVNPKYSMVGLEEYTPEEIKAHDDAAIKHFGKTYNWNETGYITLDGQRVDFSGKNDGGPGGSRTVDHRNISDAIGSEYGGEDYSGAMVQFMSEGNIRIIPETNGINLSVMPTKAQFDALSDFISKARGEVIVDFDVRDGDTVASAEYPRGTYYTKVLNDIKAYFNEGIVPQMSNAQQIWYSMVGLDENDPFDDQATAVKALGKRYQTEEQAANRQHLSILRGQRALAMYMAGITTADYLMRDKDLEDNAWNLETSRNLRRMELQSGKNVGGSLSQQLISDLTQNIEHWDIGNGKLGKAKLNATSPVRVFQEMGAWRKGRTSRDLAENSMEAQLFDEYYWGYINDQNSLKRTWMNEWGAKVRNAIKDPTTAEAALAQLLGEKFVSEGADVITGTHGTVVTDGDNVFVLDARGNVKAIQFKEKDSYYTVTAERESESAQDAKGVKKITTKIESAMRNDVKRTMHKGSLDITRNGMDVTVRFNDKPVLSIQKGTKPDMGRVNALGSVLREFYNHVKVAQQLALVLNGYNRMGELPDYFPHIGRNEVGMRAAIKAFGDNKLPESIAGLTLNFKPGKPWTSHLLSRIGDSTEFDGLRGFNRYLDAAGELIYMTPAVQRLRQLENTLRANPTGRNSNIVDWVHQYANSIAHKKADLDRSLEAMVGREVYTISDWLTKKTGQSMILGNMSSAVTNFIGYLTAIPNIKAEHVVKAIMPTLRNMMAKDGDGFDEKIPILNNRINEYEQILTNNWDKFKAGGSKVMGAFFQAVDRFAVEGAARAYYNEMKSRGLDEKTAIQRTNQFVAQNFAERSTGNLPLLMLSKTLKPFAQFQLEPMNQLSHFKDMRQYSIQEQIDVLIQMEGELDLENIEGKIKYRTPKEFLRKALYLLYLGLFGVFSRLVFGRDMTWNVPGSIYDAIKRGEENGAWSGILSAGEDVLDNLPLVSIITGGGRIPMTTGAENAITLLQTLFAGATEGGSTDTVPSLVRDTALNFTPGGNQIGKTWKGIDAMSEGAVYDRSGNKLLYPVDDDWFNYFRVILNGPTAARPLDYDYMADTLSTAQTEDYEALVDAGMDGQLAYDVLRSIDNDTKASKVLSIATYEDDGDKLSQKNMELVAAVLGIDIPSGKSVSESYGRELANDYLSDKQKDLSKGRINEKQYEEAEDKFDYWMTLIGGK